MSDKYEIDESGTIVFNQNRPQDPAEVMRYSGLAKKLDVETRDLSGEFDKAKAKIRQSIISSDKSPDNTALYTAMANFKKRRV